MKKNIKFCIKYLIKHNPFYVVANLLLVLEMVPRRLISLFALQYVVNSAVGQAPFVEIFIGCAFYLLYWIFASFARSRIELGYNPAAERAVTAQLKNDAILALSKMDLACFDDKDFYNDHLKALESVDTHFVAVFKNLCAFLSSLVSTVTLTGAVAVLSPPMLLISVASCLLALLANKKRSEITKGRINATASLKRRLEYIYCIFTRREFAKDVRTENMSGLFADEYHSVAKKLIDKEKKFGKKDALWAFAAEGASTLAEVTQWLYLAVQISQGYLSAGDFMALFNASWTLSAGLRKAVKTGPALRESSMCMEFLHFALAYPATVESGSIKSIAAVDTLSVEGLCFSYDSKATGVAGINFKISKGEKLAIVGLNGAGKSTLLKLLLRLYDPGKGAVICNGLNVKAFDVGAYRLKFATVQQDFQLYKCSILDNILMGDPRTTENREKALEALKKVGLLEKVNSLSNGINTYLSKEFELNGAVFSGGERQRIAVARALYKKADVVLLDEPSSNLDPLAEAELSLVMERSFEEAALIVVSHRLGMTKFADKIIVLDNGQIAESGSHEELLAKGGIYARMWEAQSKKYFGAQ